MTRKASFAFYYNKFYILRTTKMTSCVQQQKEQEQLLEQLNASDDEMNDNGDIDEEGEEDKDGQLLTEPTFCFSVCIQTRKNT